MAVLSHLVSRPGELVAKEELIAAVWGGQAVSDDSLSVAVYQVRKALGDDARNPRYLETVPGKGYRWIGDASGPDIEASVVSAISVREVPSEPSRAMQAHPEPPSATAPVRRHRGLAKAAAWFAATMLTVAVLTGLAFRRPQSSGEASPSGRPNAPKTVAVLPLADYSPDPPLDRSFADGMTEALIQALVRSGPLQVISRTSIRRFAGRDSLPLPEIAEKLGADLLLEGSVTVTDEDVRINVQLVEGRSDLHLWAKTYDGRADDLLKLQSEVSGAVAGEVRRWASVETEGSGAPDLTAPDPQLQGPRTERPPLALAAVEAYLEGRQALRRAGAADLRQAIAACRRAIAAEPDFAEAHALLAASATLLHSSSQDAVALKQLAETSAQRALELDPELPEAHLAVGETALFKPDLKRARLGFETALRLRLSYPEANLGLAWLSLVEGRFEEAETRIRLAIEYGPDATLPYRFLYQLEAFRGDFEAAQRAIDLITERLGPGFAVRDRWDLCLRQTTGEEAWRCMQPLLDEADAEAAARFRQIYDEEGWAGFQDHGLDETPLARWPMRRAACLLRFARAPERALAALEAAIEGGVWAAFGLAVDPQFDTLRADPRFTALLRRLDLPTDLRPASSSQASPSWP